MTKAEQTYLELGPTPGLAGVVRTVWLQRTGPDPSVQRNLPTGGVELQCVVGGACRVVGALTTADVQMLPRNTTVVGARLRPGAASALLGLPPRELVDRNIPLADVWGQEAESLAGLIAEADGPIEAVRVLQRHLMLRLARGRSQDPLVSYAVDQLMPWRHTDVGALADRLGLSSSQVRRRFVAAVGVGPKHVQRVLRFQGFLALAQAPTTSAEPAVRRLADLATRAGYADQSHLGRDCLLLSGLTPGELVGVAADRCGCGHDHAASYGPFIAPTSARSGSSAAVS